MSPVNNIYLTGFMTSGKTTTGRRLARALGFRFIDLDREIEKHFGMTVTRIFKLQGEMSFRIVEREILAKISTRKRQVIALGGGTLLLRANQKCVARSGILIFLKLHATTVLKRNARQPGRRPLLDVPDNRDRLRSIRAHLRERAPGYAKAILTIQTDQRTPIEVSRKIIRHLRPKR